MDGLATRSSRLWLTASEMVSRFKSKQLPKTVDEAVERLISELTMKDKTKIAKMDEEDLSALDRKSTRLNSSHTDISRMPSSA